MTNFGYASTETIRLDIERYTKEMLLSDEHLFGRTRVDVHRQLDQFFMGFSVQIMKEFAAYTISDKSVTFPATWWDAVKDRFVPWKWRKHFTINYRTIEVKVQEVATKLKVPEQYGPVTIAIWKNSVYDGAKGEF